MPMTDIMKDDNASDRVHLRLAIVLVAISWALAIAARWLEGFIWKMLLVIDRSCPPLYPGVWLAGLGLQIILTVVLGFRKILFVQRCALVLSGYWICAMLTSFSALIYANGSVVFGGK